MRIPALLLVLPFLVHPNGAALNAQIQPAHSGADTIPVTIRWNRLVPGIVDENAARRRAIRATATAAGDSATLRRLAQNQPPFLFRVYTLLDVAQYAAVNSVRDDRAVSADAAIAAASAAALNHLYTDSAVRASISRELARDLERAGTGSRGSERVIAGQHLGEDAAARVIAWAPPPLTMVSAWNGTIPKGPGFWYSAPGVPP
ncbi:MAG TPA: hypothetical protein VHT23_10840, partial [Gemmatimonadaceae bacterium]|nr:hypothetical protein [Gemmatimonadaceae bacterium]